MSRYIIPVFIAFVIVYGAIKKAPLYDSFAEGIRQSIKLVIEIIPFIATIFIAMELMNVSGFSDMISAFFAPVFNFFGVPKELSKLVILRPLSGNGSIAMLEEIYVLHGVDSYISRCASVIVGCSETIFYISAVYFSTSSIKKLRYAIPVALISMYIGVIVACFVIKIM